MSEDSLEIKKKIKARDEPEKRSSKIKTFFINFIFFADYLFEDGFLDGDCLVGDFSEGALLGFVARGASALVG